MADKYVPQRRCIGCGKSFPKSELLRFTKNGDSIEFDEMQRGQNRGFYLCKNEKCLALAKKKKRIPKEFEAFLGGLNGK